MEKFINVYKDEEGKYLGDIEYNSFEEALRNKDDVGTYIETIKFARIKN